MTEFDQSADFKARLRDLAGQFDELSRQPIKSPVRDMDPTVKNWSTATPEQYNAEQQAGLLYSGKIRRLVSNYRQLVIQAGELLIAMHGAGLIGDQSLAAVVAAYETDFFTSFLKNPANLFALLVGGPRFELRDFLGNVAEYQKENHGWPVDFDPAAEREGNDAALSRLGIEFPPDPDQCRRYADFCSELAEQIQVQPRSVASAEYNADLIGNKIPDPSSPMKASQIASIIWPDEKGNENSRKRALRWMKRGKLPANIADFKDHYRVSVSALDLLRKAESSKSDA